jgi:hypothetical protein
MTGNYFRFDRDPPGSRRWFFGALGLLAEGIGDDWNDTTSSNAPTNYHLFEKAVIRPSGSLDH